MINNFIYGFIFGFISFYLINKLINRFFFKYFYKIKKFIRKYILHFFLCITGFLIFESGVSANTYTTDTNLFENSYSSNLIDMAISQVDNFYNKDYVIFTSNDTYYLVTGTLESSNNNNVVLKDTTVIRCYRNGTGYNYTWNYSTSSETSTIINLNNHSITNIKTSYSISSSKMEEYRNNHNLILLGTLICGLCFALFLFKGRSY